MAVIVYGVPHGKMSVTVKRWPKHSCGDWGHEWWPNQAHTFRLLKCEYSEDKGGDEYINTVRCKTYQLWKAINQEEEKKQCRQVLKNDAEERVVRISLIEDGTDAGRQRGRNKPVESLGPLCPGRRGRSLLFLLWGSCCGWVWVERGVWWLIMSDSVGGAPVVWRFAAMFSTWLWIWWEATRASLFSSYLSEGPVF